MPISFMDLETSLAELMDIREEIITEQPGLRAPEERQQALAVIEDALAGYVKREVAKVDGIHGYCRYAAATAEAARAEAAVLLDKAKRLEAQEARLKDLCMAVMVATGKEKLQGSAGRVIARQKNGGKQSLQVQDGVIPDALCDYTITLQGETYARVKSLLSPAWRDVIERAVKERKASQERVREELAQPCGYCGGSGAINGNTEQGPCGECGGAGTNRVPGAQLLERGETIRIK